MGRRAGPHTRAYTCGRPAYGPAPSSQTSAGRRAAVADLGGAAGGRRRPRGVRAAVADQPDGRRQEATGGVRLRSAYTGRRRAGGGRAAYGPAPSSQTSAATGGMIGPRKGALSGRYEAARYGADWRPSQRPQGGRRRRPRRWGGADGRRRRGLRGRFAIQAHTLAAGGRRRGRQKHKAAGGRAAVKRSSLRKICYALAGAGIAVGAAAALGGADAAALVMRLLIMGAVGSGVWAGIGRLRAWRRRRRAAGAAAHEHTGTLR